MKSVMTHQFSQVPKVNIERSVFNRSHGYKTTFDSGYLIPIYHDMVYPGDTFTMRASGFARMSTPIKAPMDNMYIDTFFFFCPWRLIWDNFVKFMGEQEPNTFTAYTIPYMVINNVAVGTLSDYLGLPTGIAQNININSFYHRMYNLTWNQWFRDESLQASVTVDKGDGPDVYGNYVLLKRGKRKDYFTSCLPWTQKSSAAVQVPLGTSATVKTAATGLIGGAQNPMLTLMNNGGASPTNQALGFFSASGDIKTASGSPVTPNSTGAIYPTNLYADLSTATAATINSLRQAFQLQRYYEKDARGGSRYTEKVRSHFGVVSPDARLQRVEFLGGSRANVNIHPVPQTTPTPAAGTTTPQGNISGFGTVSFTNHGFSKSFTEHGFILGLVCVTADLTYQQGLNKEFSYRTPTDLYWPSFAHLGEQSVLNKEIYCQGDANDDLVFGYQERYAELKYKPSQITGKFRSTYATPLDMWHLSQKFTALPTLGDTFIKETPPIDRIQAVNTEPQFFGDFYFDLKCSRPMPLYSVPGLIDHF